MNLGAISWYPNTNKEQKVVLLLQDGRERGNRSKMVEWSFSSLHLGQISSHV